MFNSVKTYEFSYEGLALMKENSLEHKIEKVETWLKDPINYEVTAMAICTATAITYIKWNMPYWMYLLMEAAPVSADPYAKLNKAGGKIISIAQFGIRWLSMIVVFYGLYMQLLKKDDGGKKIAVGAVLVYIISLLVPWAYDSLDGIFKE